MPEGPTIYLLRENVRQFNRKKILKAPGNAQVDLTVLTNKTVTFKTWGKHFLLAVKGATVRIHFLMFGSYSINEQIRPNKSLRLSLQFKNGTVYFYTCSVKLLDDTADNIYDWSADVMSDRWDEGHAKKKLKALPGTMVCDALLDQQVFAGVGNIIKNEVLYRSRIHPESSVEKIPAAKLLKMINEASSYSFEFLKWKKEGVLKKHWEAYTKKKCLRCNLPFEKKYCGKTKRRTFFCENCQVLYK